MEDSFIVGKKIASDKKWGGSEAGKPWTLKSRGLEPRSLTEVNAYGNTALDGTEIIFALFVCVNYGPYTLL